MYMEVKIAVCSHCSSNQLVKNGRTKYGSQRCLCKECGKSRVPFSKGTGVDFRTLLILKLFRERLSLRGIIRTFGISWQKLYSLFNAHVKGLMPHRHSVRKPGQDDVLEYDELCSYVGRKAHKQWLWTAISRQTRQIVAWVIGDRSNATFKRLLRKVPPEYLNKRSYSDHWKAYRILLSKGNHKMTGKGDGETCHMERWNCTLRQRISRFVRRTLSFSKKKRYHHMATKLFIWFYNMEVKPSTL